MPIKTWDGKIEDTEIVCETVEEELSIHAAPVLEYHVRTEVNRADKVDCMVAASSGVLTSAMDILWVGEFSLFKAQNIGTDYINKFVISFAKAKGCTKSDLKECIRFLEKEYPLATDKLTSEFGGGLQHHLRDFSHHASPFGLICSILNQFTLKGYGTDTDGRIITPNLPDSVAVGNTFKEKIWWGVVEWTFHLISDMAGSSGSKGRGTGIPGPILSLAKVLSATPLFRDLRIQYKDDEIGISIWISKLFNGTAFSHSNKDDIVRFDLRTELGVDVFATKQMVPVFINQCIVRSFYFVRRFAEECSLHGIANISDLKLIDFGRVKPFNNRCIDRMITIATGTFTVIDGADAAIRAQMKNPKSKSEFVSGMLLRVNFAGIGAFAISIKKEIKYLVEDTKALINQEIRAIQLSDDKAVVLPECDVEIEVLMDNRGIYEYSFMCMLNHINKCHSDFKQAQQGMLSIQKSILNITDENGKLFSTVAKMSRHSILVETEELIMRLFKQNNVPYIPFEGNEKYAYMPFYREEDGKRIAYIFDTSITGRVDNWTEIKDKYLLDEIKVVGLVDLQDDKELLNTLVSFEESKTNGFVRYIPIKHLFDLIGEDEYSVYLEYAERFNKEVHELIGYSTITIPSKEMLADFKERALNTIKSFDYSKFLADLREPQVDIILTNYIEKERYRVVLGESNLADSFLSAEWYYSIHNSTSGIEQTAIIAGYLKAVEQLLYAIIQLSINSGKDIKQKNSKEYIPYTSANENDVDYTLGSMIGYVKHYQELWHVNKYARFFIGDILTQYRIKYRNDHFHKDNVYHISEIEEIREQTFLLFALLLGGARLSDTDVERMNPYHKIDIEPQSLSYLDVEKWLDSILGGDNLLNPNIPIYFMMQGYSNDRWQLHFCTVKGFIENKFPDDMNYLYVCDTLMWPNILEKEAAEEDLISFISQYLERGKYGMKLKQHPMVSAGHFGHPIILYEKI